MDVLVHPDSTLFLLPAPVTCFSHASYSQRQTFRLADETANLVLLDWFTSGRIGETWEFARYRSQNEVWLGGKRVVRDVLLLEDENPTGEGGSGSGGETSYRQRVEPYSCYVTLTIFGPAMAPILAHLDAAFESITQYHQPRPYSMLWSFSKLEGGRGGIARCAGDGAETVREWVVQVLADGGIEKLVGKDLWKTAFT